MDEAVEDVVIGICESWICNTSIGTIRGLVVQQIEDGKRNGVNVQAVASEMSKELAGGEGWTVEDARMLKDVFSQYGVVFKVEI